MEWSVGVVPWYLFSFNKQKRTHKKNNKDQNPRKNKSQKDTKTHKKERRTGGTFGKLEKLPSPVGLS